MVVDVLVTKEDVILLSGLSCYYAAVAATDSVAATITAAEMTVFGLSSSYSAAADGETVTAAASKPRFLKREYRISGTPFFKSVFWCVLC